MSNKWLFKIDLQDESVFEKIEHDYHIAFPYELKDFVKENNACSPKQNIVELNDNERVYNETLSFNTNEEEAPTFDSAMKAVNRKEYIPFARDPFGNYYCYCLENGTVSFYNHEEDYVENSNTNFKDFINKLH